MEEFIQSYILRLHLKASIINIGQKQQLILGALNAYQSVGQPGYLE